MGGLSSRFHQVDEAYIGDMVLYDGDELPYAFPIHHGPLPDGHVAGCDFCRLYFQRWGYVPMWVCPNFVENPSYHAGA